MLGTRLAPLILAALALAARAQETVQLYILAGQSNAVGYGTNAAQLPVELAQPQPDVQFLFEEGYYDPGLRISSNGQLVPLAPQTATDIQVFGGPLSGFGEELTLGRALKDNLGGNVCVAKFAISGTSLSVCWVPGAPLPLYPSLMANIAAAKAQLEGQGKLVQFAGFFWMQGEWDAQFHDLAQLYETNLASFIASVRADLHTPALPFVIGRIHTQLSLVTSPIPYPFVQEVRAAQVAVANAVPGVRWVDIDDLPLNADHVHLTSAAQQTLGERFAWTMFGGLPYGQSANNPLKLDWNGQLAIGKTFLARTSALDGPICGLAASLGAGYSSFLGQTALISVASWIPFTPTAPVVGGTSEIALALPASAALVGLPFYLQTFAPSASQASGWALSNGLRLIPSP